MHTLYSSLTPLHCACSSRQLRFSLTNERTLLSSRWQDKWLSSLQAWPQIAHLCFGISRITLSVSEQERSPSGPNADSGLNATWNVVRDIQQSPERDMHKQRQGCAIVASPGRLRGPSCGVGKPRWKMNGLLGPSSITQSMPVPVRVATV